VDTSDNGNPFHLPNRAKCNFIGNIMRVVIDTNVLVAALPRSKAERSRSSPSISPISCRPQEVLVST